MSTTYAESCHTPTKPGSSFSTPLSTPSCLASHSNSNLPHHLLLQHPSRHPSPSHNLSSKSYATPFMAEWTPKQKHQLWSILKKQASAKKSCRMSPKTLSPKSYFAKKAAVEGWATQNTNPSEWLTTYSPRKGKKMKANYDRFIPSRNSTVDLQASQFNLQQPTLKKTSQFLDAEDRAYQKEVAKACGVALGQRILKFNAPAPTSNKEDLRSHYQRALKTSAPLHLRRKIYTNPERVLDAPGMVDDYYLNLLDWTSNNLVTIALEEAVYVWNGETGVASEFCRGSEEESVTSISSTAGGHHIAVGTAEGKTHIYDLSTQQKLRTMNCHSARVGVLSWEKHILSTGCQDGSIGHHDVRQADHHVAQLLGHTGEVCGLSWRADGHQLASGGNDNTVHIWDARSSIPKFTKTNHTAAVKALAWCPWQLNLLATGGGSCDRNIHFWNTSTATRLNSIDTGSQVTSLTWSKEYKEIASTHGYPNNQITLWGYPSLKRIIDLPGHDSRILHSALSPDGQILATVASDENLKFWKIFETCTSLRSLSLENRKDEGAGTVKKEAPLLAPRSIR